MHVSAPNFDICVTLSVGIKHATAWSNAQACGRRSQACTTFTVNGWQNCANVSLSSISINSLFHACFYLFALLFVRLRRDRDGKMLTYLSLLSSHNWDAWHACRPIWHLLCQQAWEKLITGPALPHLPSSSRHDSTLHSHPLRNLFYKQGMNTHVHMNTGGPSGATVQWWDVAARSSISFCRHWFGLGESPMKPNTLRWFKRPKWQFWLCVCAGLPWMCGIQM